jgi:hypothetical protein
MTAAVLSARAMVPADSPAALTLAAQVVVGAATYGATLLLLHRTRVLPFLGLVRGLRPGVA